MTGERKREIEGDLETLSQSQVNPESSGSVKCWEEEMQARESWVEQGDLEIAE